MMSHRNVELSSSRWSYPTDGSLRLGAELKFPMTTSSGEPVSRQIVDLFWLHMLDQFWAPLRDDATCTLVGATKAVNVGRHTVSCETGYCKIEFALAPVPDLFALQRTIDSIGSLIRSFTNRNDARFLAVGIHPVALPSRKLMARTTRASIWDNILVSNNHVSVDHGHDVHLFTLNAGSHVHLNVPGFARLAVMNVLNAFVPAQLALTANSTVWQGGIDKQCKCVNEMMWDWWLNNGARCGVPDRPFDNHADYVDFIAQLPILFVNREAGPILIPEGLTLAQYLKLDECEGTTVGGARVVLKPNADDVGTHYSCCWHCNRLTRYDTVENRTNDQQLPNELISVSALTLGLVSALPEALEAVNDAPWSGLPELRRQACLRYASSASSQSVIYHWCNQLLTLANLGLKRRKLGEEVFLAPLQQRLQDRTTPSDLVVQRFKTGGMKELIQFLSI